MTSNDEIILKEILTKQKQQSYPELSESSFFELFVADKCLIKYDLSDEEVEAGITGKGDDGGIDSIYTFVNGKLIYEDTDLSRYRKDVSIDLVIIQSKTSNSFTETVIQRLEDTTIDILELSKLLNEFELYNKILLARAEYFRSTYKELISKFPSLSIFCIYASQGNVDQIHKKVKGRVTKLEYAVKNLLPNTTFNFLFLGARELIRLASSSQSASIQMQLLENPIATKKGGYSCLVSLQEYYKFITDSDGQLKKGIFEANVRDYEGDVEVNQDIRESLVNNTNEDFWWLNNGVTIIADRGSVTGKTLTLENVQIVNGLQTSMEIYTHFKLVSTNNDERSVLVKIITTEDSASRDRIIKATNRQTSVPLASLRATDEIQRDIEYCFFNYNYYYDRRKNFYKNQGKPKEKIISIPYLAQAVMAIALKEPDIARARPSSLLKKQDDYEKVFTKNYPIKLYLNCVLLMRKVTTYIKLRGENLLEERSNLKFHIAMYVAIHRMGKIDYTPKEIAEIDISSIDEQSLEKCFLRVVEIFQNHRAKTKRTADVSAKSKDLVAEILSDFGT